MVEHLIVNTRTGGIRHLGHDVHVTDADLDPNLGPDWHVLDVQVKRPIHVGRWLAGQWKAAVEA